MPTATFLKHGGHVWDTAFDVKGIYGLAGEDVTVLEAISAVPEADTYAMMLAGLGLIGWVRHRPSAHKLDGTGFLTPVGASPTVS